MCILFIIVCGIYENVLRDYVSYKVGQFSLSKYYYNMFLNLLIFFSLVVVMGVY